MSYITANYKRKSKLLIDWDTSSVHKCSKCRIFIRSIPLFLVWFYSYKKNIYTFFFYKKFFLNISIKLDRLALLHTTSEQPQTLHHHQLHFICQSTINNRSFKYILNFQSRNFIIFNNDNNLKIFIKFF